MKRNIIFILFFHFLALSPVGATEYSGTLPVIHIDTNESIVSKNDYVEGTFYLEVFGNDDFLPLGSAEYRLPLLVRGRGNWTWYGDFEKKSYKLKLQKKLPLLGMNSNKHYALLAHADGSIESYYRNAAGFELGRLLGLEFTPHHQPVELVLNGEYMGLYFLTETVRVGGGRVDIVEQNDYETDIDLITGGWLVEIDNVYESNQVRANVKNTGLLRFLVTYHSPENLSDQQFDYLSNQVSNILRTVYTEDKSSTEWEDIIDLDVLTRFYLVHEILDNVEGFLGSCYLYKDLGETKWKFGPLWDLGHAFNMWHPKDQFIYDYDNGWEPCIMKEIALFPRFQAHLREVWLDNYELLYKQLDASLVNLSATISQAAVADHARWPQYGTPSVSQSLARCSEYLRLKRLFLTGEWGGEISSLHSPTVDGTDNNFVYDLQGRLITSNAVARGIYVKNGKKFIR